MPAEKQFGPGVSDRAVVAIGIDQSLTGFALSFVDVSDPRQHDTRVYKSPYRGAERLADIRRWMNQRFAAHPAARVVDAAMENTVRASMAASVLGELAGTVKLAFWDHFRSLPPQRPLMVAPMSLKMFVAASGKATKSEMLLKVYKNYGVELNDDNAADAYGLAVMAAGFTTTAAQAKILDKLADPKYRD